MFLTENTNLRYYNEANSDPMYALEIANEATDAYNALCMAMMKVEHKAIMSENASLLQEAESQFSKKASAIYERAKQKFLAFIDKVKASWTRLCANIQAAFFSTKNYRKYLDELKSSGTAKTTEKKVSLPADIAKLRELMKSAGTVSIGAANDMNNLLTKINSDDSFGDSGMVKTKDDAEVLVKGMNAMETYLKVVSAEKHDVSVDIDDAEECLAFLQKRKAINIILDHAKKQAMKDARKDYKNLTSSEKKNGGSIYISILSRMYSKVITYVNKLTSLAIKICNAFKREN